MSNDPTKFGSKNDGNECKFMQINFFLSKHVHKTCTKHVHIYK